MKKIMFAAACAALSLTTITATAQEIREQNFSLTLGGGVLSYQNEIGLGSIAKDSAAFTPKFTARILDSKFTFVAKGLYSKVKYEEFYEHSSNGRYDYYCFYEDISETIFGISGEIQYDLIKDDITRVYVSGGIAYRAVDQEYTILEGIFDSKGNVLAADGADVAIDYKGTAPFVNIGFEYTVNNMYAYMPVSYMSSLYDEEDVGEDMAEGQVNFDVTLGYKVKENLRTDINVQYMASWEELIAGVGVTFLF